MSKQVKSNYQPMPTSSSRDEAEERRPDAPNSPSSGRAQRYVLFGLAAVCWLTWVGFLFAMMLSRRTSAS